VPLIFKSEILSFDWLFFLFFFFTCLKFMTVCDGSLSNNCHLIGIESGGFNEGKDTYF